MNRLLIIALWIVLLGVVPIKGLDEGGAVEQRIEALQEEIAYHDDLYFRKGTPEITDAEYDRLKRELRDLEAGIQRREGDAGSMGDDRTGDFPEARHKERMLSLNKAYNREELRAYLNDVAEQLGSASWVIEPKYDGLAISLIYERGRLVRAVTRGNGAVGDDVTATMHRVKGVVEWLSEGAPSYLELRGEIFLTEDEFERINRERKERGLKPYAHPRNLAVGTLKSSGEDFAVERELSLVVFGWGEWDGTRPESQLAFYDYLKRWGLPMVEEYEETNEMQGVMDAVRRFEKQRRKWSFPTDGVVIKLNQVTLRDALGEGSTAPNWAVAYKYPPDKGVSSITAIVPQIGRTGVLTPVAEFEPVELSGSTVRRASLHNYANVRRLDLRVGDWVMVEKAGEVIPQIESVLVERREAGLRTTVMPIRCPVCNTPLWMDAEVSVLGCPNYVCPDRMKQQLAYFASARGVGIRGIGQATAERLYAAGLVRTPADYYRLQEDELASVVGAKRAAKLIRAIERSRGADLEHVLVGLGISGIGPAGAKVLVRHCSSLEDLAEMELNEEKLAGLNASAVAGLREFLNHQNGREIVRDLAKFGLGKRSESKAHDVE